MALLRTNPLPRSPRSARPVGHILYRLLALVGILALAGCGGSTPSGGPGVTPTSSSSSASSSSSEKPLASDDEILKKLDDALEFTCQNRRLNLKDHAAWQIVHGALAFGRDFQITDNEGKDVSAIQYLLDGGKMTGWTMEKGRDFGDPPRPGLRAVVEAGSKTGQGHADQWLGYLSDVGLQLDQEIKAAGHTFTIEDYLRQVEYDAPYNVEQEYSWTVMSLSAYRPTDYEWTAGDGNRWSLAKLMQIEVEHDLATSACGGTHRMCGIVMALNRHKAAGGKLEGAWKAADDKVRQCVEAARKFQNPDGSLSTHYFQRPGNAPDIRERLGCTGHALEFVILSSTDEELKQPWIKRAVVYLSDLLHKTKKLDLECGALYHAAHGLVLYRQRVYGPKSYVGG